jgi:hypothetical protein
MAVSPTHFLSPPTQLTQERGSGGWADTEDRRANASATTIDLDAIAIDYFAFCAESKSARPIVLFSCCSDWFSPVVKRVC